ncbi:zinc finger protein-like [Tropilaelaps mercedesae]|uniref:Zinc finger protein-like n=1 Tax=Tropilaelaps mercedesae TaxID=418985 RepID=A0A1V9Y3U1_9ACAR|nr:zinc finger protein-like [Tropilaelaps mercedesae]
MDGETRLACLTCRVIFASAELHRNHYQCDWHRYNLKRKVASLPPVTAEGFNQRVIASQQTSIVSTNDLLHCRNCKKAFKSAQTLESHLKSKAHLDIVKKENPLKTAKFEALDRRPRRNGPPRIRPPITESLDISEVISGSPDEDEDDWEDIELSELDNETQAGQHERDVEIKPADGVQSGGNSDNETVEKMEEEPRKFQLVDCIPTHVCLFCNKLSSDMEQNLEHMAINHSFFIPDSEYLVNAEGLLLYLGYKVGALKICLLCDNDEKTPFSSIMAVQQHMIDKCHTAMDFESPLEYSEFYDYSSSHPEGDPEDEFDPEVLYANEDWTLQLPSGAYIGHRCLMRYYRQHLPAEPTVKPARKNMLVFQKYKALGWTNTTTASQARMKARDQKVAQRLLARQKIAVQLKTTNIRNNKKQLFR